MMMKTKMVKDLEIGDLVPLKEPDGLASVARKERSRLFDSPGGCWRFDFKVIEGPHRGKKIPDQHHAGYEEIEIKDSPVNT